jgi:hypothetical protein
LGTDDAIIPSGHAADIGAGRVCRRERLTDFIDTTEAADITEEQFARAVAKSAIR